ncbi:hypothetical protein A8990_12665 [Paenibacillus taihuensis]|uniref:Uncharacterized protein n=1 Tax=Paenibacillus taihuensis TaxID=1156355 RepID=A0A3D9RR72_9BACL|nr:hypothetical protein A8990_12665 [Paenibacillus taihuensis]
MNKRMKGGGEPDESSIFHIGVPDLELGADSS